MVDLPSIIFFLNVDQLHYSQNEFGDLMKKPSDTLKQSTTTTFKEEVQLEMKLVFNLKSASKILDMPESTIKQKVREGFLERCTHISEKVYYFNIDQLKSFANYKNSPHE